MDTNMYTEKLESVLNDINFDCSHAGMYEKENYHRGRVYKILSLIEECDPQTIFEIGGGEGFLAKLALSMEGNKINHYYFGEIVDKNIVCAQNNLSSDKVSIIKFDACIDEIEVSPDLLICSEVLEHVLDYDIALDIIFKASPRRIIISVPNEVGVVGFLKNTIRKFYRKLDVPYSYLFDCLLKRNAFRLRQSKVGELTLFVTHVGFDSLRFQRQLERKSKEDYSIKDIKNKYLGLITVGNIFVLDKKNNR